MSLWILTIAAIIIDTIEYSVNEHGIWSETAHKITSAAE